MDKDAVQRSDNMMSILEKGSGTFEGIKLLLCENPLPPIEEAITAAQADDNTRVVQALRKLL